MVDLYEVAEGHAVLDCILARVPLSASSIVFPGLFWMATAHPDRDFDLDFGLSRVCLYLDPGPSPDLYPIDQVSFSRLGYSPQPPAR